MKKWLYLISMLLFYVANINAANSAFFGAREVVATKGVLNPNEIHFMQSSIKNTTGEFTVLRNAKALKSGTLNPEVLRARCSR